MLKEESKAESMMNMMARFSGIMHSRRPFGDMPRAEFCVLNLLYDYKEKEEVTVGKIAGGLPSPPASCFPFDSLELLGLKSLKASLTASWRSAFRRRQSCCMCWRKKDT